MTLPGHSVTIGEVEPSGARGGGAATAFMVGITEKGPSDRPVVARSLAEWVETFGSRQSYSQAAYDAADIFFREGGSLLYTARVIGPAPVKATANILDQSGSTVPGDVALVVTAKSAGEWANALNHTITVDGTNFRITITHDTDGTLETSPLLATRDDAVAWAANVSEYVDIALGASNEDPRAQGPTSLAGGTDDRANIADAHWAAALALLTPDYGPGQVMAPGRTTSAGYTQLLGHAAAHNRRALLDGADTATVSTLTSASLALRGAAGHTDRFGKLLAPWVIYPGLAAGTTRTVAPSAFQAGRIAAAEAAGRNPNEAAAGALGVSAQAVGISQAAWTDADRETLNEAGVSVFRLFKGSVTIYGDRTLVNPLTDSNWKSFANSRLIMAIAAACDDVMDAFDFAQIDGRGNVFAKLGGELRGRALLPFYQAEALYGETPEDAFLVDVGPDVNTPSTIANGEIKAKVAVTVSPNGERLNVEIVKRALEGVA